MDNNLNNRDFEQFIKQNADQYRMFPSEKVWENINTSLHTRNRWFTIGIALFFITTATVTGIMLINPSAKKLQTTNTITINTDNSVKSVQENKIADLKTPAIIFTPSKLFIENRKLLFSHLPLRIQQKNIFLNLPVSEENNIEYQDKLIASEKNISNPTVPLVAINQKDVANNLLSNPKIAPEKNNINFSTVQENINIDFPQTKEEINESYSSCITKKETHDLSPLTIESIVNSYKYIRTKKKLSWQVFITPTISYRKLNENKAFINSAQSNNTGPSLFYSPGINSIVTHKPDIGVQMGFITGYPLSRKIKIISGLQFNVSKYDIRAYRYTSEITTIALRTSTGASSSVSTVTNYRNTGGNKIDWLHNLYLSASAPIGIEVKLINSKRNYIGVAGTAQPSYILTNRSYLISTDYKNYAEIPSLIRKWNINTGFELFAGNTSGKLKWRIGPHVRYQTMSSYKKKYPVQEHLFDFGLKLGLQLSK